MQQKNLDIRQELKNHNLFYWQLAEKFGVTDGTLSRKLRKEFTEKEKALAFQYILELKENC